MSINAHLEKELADAEAALQKAEEEFGKDDIKVSYRLDAIVRILNTNKIRTLDAKNLEARARQIRIKVNQADLAKITPQMQQVSEAVKIASKRQEKEKNQRGLVSACVVLVFAGIACKYIFYPTPGERKIGLEIMKKVDAVLPSTMVKQMIDKGQQAVKDVEVANKAHSDQIDRVMDGNLQGLDGTGNGMGASAESGK